MIEVTFLPARTAKGALSALRWAQARIGMRDKGVRVLDNKRLATKTQTKPVAPGTQRSIRP